MCPVQFLEIVLHSCFGNFFKFLKLHKEENNIVVLSACSYLKCSTVPMRRYVFQVFRLRMSNWLVDFQGQFNLLTVYKL